MAVNYLDKAKRVMTKTETEAKVCEALSRQNWGASSTQMREIANLTFDYQEYSVVMKEVWNKVDYPKEKWRQIFKALVLLEYLIKHGAERVIEESRSHMFKLKALTSFSYKDEEGREKGTGIRENAKRLIDLLEDTEAIREERKKAKKLKNKYTGLGNNGISPSSTFDKYESYDFDNSSSRYKDTDKKYGGYRDDETGGSGERSRSQKKRGSDTYRDEEEEEAGEARHEDNDSDDFGELASKSRQRFKSKQTVSSTAEGEESNQQKAVGKGKLRIKLKQTTSESSANQKSTTVAPTSASENLVDDLLGDLNDVSISAPITLPVGRKDEPQEDIFSMSDDQKPSVSNGQSSTKPDSVLDPFATIAGTEDLKVQDNDAEWGEFESAPSSNAKDGGKGDLFSFTTTTKTTKPTNSSATGSDDFLDIF